MTDVMPVPLPAVPDYGRPPRRGRSVGRALGWAFAAVVGLGLLGSVLLPNLCKSGETANRAKCASNLHQIGLAILMYQQDHGGAYPDTLGRLAQTEPVGADVFVCPSGDEVKSTADSPADEIDAGPAGHHCSYLYFGRGLTGTVSDTTVIACDAPDEHDRDGVNVLYGDGHADWETCGRAVTFLPPQFIPADPRWQRALAATRAAGALSN